MFTPPCATCQTMADVEKAQRLEACVRMFERLRASNRADILGHSNLVPRSEVAALAAVLCESYKETHDKCLILHRDARQEAVRNALTLTLRDQGYGTSVLFDVPPSTDARRPVNAGVLVHAPNDSHFVTLRVFNLTVFAAKML